MISEEHSKNNTEKKQITGIAKQRWKLLAQLLQKPDKFHDMLKNSVSIRRFSTFGLFNVENLTKNNQCVWQQYSLNYSNNLFSVKVRQLCSNLNPDKLQGFDNTGNICIWPAEEIMSYYCIKNTNLFRDKNIIEIGGGMTCLAGFAVAVTCEAKSVHVTDGNEDSVENLNIIVEENKEQFGYTNVTSSLFRWGPNSVDDNLKEKFDFILCSDCIYYKEGRYNLIQSMYNLLQSQGEVIVFAPNRKDSIQIFTQLAQEYFHIEIITKYDEKISKLDLQFKETSVYDEDIHYPLFIKMVKKDII